MSIIYHVVRYRTDEFTSLSHDGVTLECRSRRFYCYSASAHHAMTSVVYVLLFVASWFAAIDVF